jgi:hypothetical protein
MPLLADINLNVDLSAGHFGSSQRAGLVLFACLLGSFLFIRTSSRLIRSPRFTWWPGSVKTKGGLHVHHLVFGIIAMMLSGFLGFALAPVDRDPRRRLRDRRRAHPRRVRAVAAPGGRLLV